MVHHQRVYCNKNYHPDQNNDNNNDERARSNRPSSEPTATTTTTYVVVHHQHNKNVVSSTTCTTQIDDNNFSHQHDNINHVRWSKLLRHDGQPTKVLLYPEEGWARTATNSYWLLSIPWWNRNRCKVVQVSGTRRSTTQAKLIDAGKGTVYVIGSFGKESMEMEPDFKLSLTSHVSTADVHLGYLMTGTLERGYPGSSLQLTHFAVLRKFD